MRQKKFIASLAAVLSIGAAGALSAAPATDAAPVATRGQVSPFNVWDEWEDFKKTNVSVFDSGARVIDYSDSRRITTSEGQSYAMFFALVAGERELFDKLLCWTEENLAAGDLTKNAPAWLWGKNVKTVRVSGEDGTVSNKTVAAWEVLDSNNATDSDMWIAYSLLEAGRLWKRPDYTAKGRAMLVVLKSQTRHIRQLGHVLLPGKVGFESKKGVLLNPSYYPLFIFKRFAAEDAFFTEVCDASLRAVIRSAPDGYAPDWARFDYAGNLTAERDNLGSYNAIRTYMWAAMTAQNDPAYDILKKQFSAMIDTTMRLRLPPEKVDLNTLKINRTGPDSFGACLLAYMDSIAEDQGEEASYRNDGSRTASFIRTLIAHRTMEPDSYYSNVLSLYAIGFDRRYFAFAPDGRVLVSARLNPELVKAAEKSDAAAEETKTEEKKK